MMVLRPAVMMDNRGVSDSEAQNSWFFERALLRRKAAELHSDVGAVSQS